MIGLVVVGIIAYILIGVFVGRGTFKYIMLKNEKKANVNYGSKSVAENSAITAGVGWPIFAIGYTLYGLYWLTLKQAIRLEDYIITEIVSPKTNVLRSGEEEES